MTSGKKLEDQIVETSWTDRDYDCLVDYILDKKLGLESVDELSMD